jgi:hypothetical protein
MEKENKENKEESYCRLCIDFSPNDYLGGDWGNCSFAFDGERILGSTKDKACWRGKTEK